MKKTTYIIISLFVWSMALTTVSCSDMLDQESDHVIYTDKGHLNNATDTLYSVIGIMNKLQVLSDRTVLLGELRGDLVDINNYTSADLRDIATFNIGDDNKYNSPRDYYAVINNCNYFIAKADTALKNNRNEYIFRREYAAVKAFRAWTYMQLVLNYGKVPLVTTPILSKDDADREYEKADITTVCKYFAEDIAPYANERTPEYGVIRGNDSQLFYFPIYLLMGELNLWAGNYREAALNYYRYISTRNGQNSAFPMINFSVQWAGDKFQITYDNYTRDCFESESSNSEIINMIPGDSIPSEGNYSELHDIFSSTIRNQNHNAIEPSQQLKDLSASQKYCHLNSAGEVQYAPSDLTGLHRGDLRLNAVYSQSFFIGGDNAYNSSEGWNNAKFSTRNVHIYRGSVVYLRMAEALNRAGFPRFAFAILKTGVNNNVIENDIMPYYPGEEAFLEQFNFPNTQYVLRTKANLTSQNTIGVHSRGCGWADLDNTYAFPDNEDITDNHERLDYQIEGVENLIIDECALETCFEGFRFHDLMRVALRRNNPSYLADKVYSRRGSQNISEMKSLIKCDLSNTANWYLKWNGKIGINY